MKEFRWPEWMLFCFLSCQVLALSGCFAEIGRKQDSVGRPLFQFQPKVEITQKNVDDLQAIQKQYPETFIKIDALHREFVQQNAEVEAYTKNSIRVEVKQLENLGYTEQEALEMQKARLKVHGWPELKPENGK